MKKPPTLKPVRSTYTPKWSDPHDIYRGNSNHWSVMRVEGETRAAKAQERERQEKGQVIAAPAPYPGCSDPPYVWSKERALKLRGQSPFYDLVLEGLGGLLPGDLSKDLHKNYNKAIIRWPPNPFSAQAKKNVRYWPADDLTPNVYRPKMDRNKLPF